MPKKKEKKLKKIPLWHHFKPKYVRKGREREKKKNNCFVLSNPTRNRKFQKNSKKILKIKKYHYGYSSTHPRLKEDEKGRKEKLSFRTVPT